MCKQIILVVQETVTDCRFRLANGFEFEFLSFWVFDHQRTTLICKLYVCLFFSGSIDLKSGNGGVRQYVTLERPIGTSKPVQLDRKLLVKSCLFKLVYINAIV